jgi:hypothetical protein
VRAPCAVERAERDDRLDVHRQETFIAGHVHLAPVNVAGAIVVPLFLGPATSASHIKQSGIATPNARTTGTPLCQNPSAYYVNYHTTAFTGGAIRGQLH